MEVSGELRKEKFGPQLRQILADCTIVLFLLSECFTPRTARKKCGNRGVSSERHTLLGTTTEFPVRTLNMEVVKLPKCRMDQVTCLYICKKIIAALYNGILY